MSWNKEVCPVCRVNLIRQAEPRGDLWDVACPNCTPFVLTGSALQVLENGLSAKDLAKVAHGIFGRGSLPVTSDTLESFCTTILLPDARGMVDGLLQSLAEEVEFPGGSFNLKAATWSARIGARDVRGVIWAIEQCMELGHIVGKRVPTLNPSEYAVVNCGLTLDGWKRVQELLTQAKDSRKAFIAMKFGVPELDKMFKEHWIPAVARTGFRLQRLDDEPRAGLIDDRLRTEIRTSRFLVADLTHANPGAYWEGGFAEGLGRPVIYLCRRDVFDDPTTRPHFDTNHHLTVRWDPASPEAGCQDLVASIRATFPSDAIFEG